MANAYIGKAGALKDLKKNDEYVATLKEGLEAVPGNKTLTKLYATYYVNQGILAQRAKKTVPQKKLSNKRFLFSPTM